jgi:hypothetical protein
MSSKPLKKIQPQPEASPEVSLAERINQARADADAYIQSLAQKIKDEGNPVPIGMLRQMLDKGSRCHCQVALGLMKDKRHG